jgi:hypothetical protein
MGRTVEPSVRQAAYLCIAPIVHAAAAALLSATFEPPAATAPSDPRC